jgi:NAD(P)H-flavin reductase
MISNWITATTAPPTLVFVGTAFAVVAVTTVAVIYYIKTRIPRAPTLLPLDDYLQVPLIDKKILSHDTRQFTFGLPTSDTVLGLKIGQHLSLMYCDSQTQKNIQRSYTPVDASRPGQFSLVVKVYRPLPPKFPQGGLMSQHLDQLQIGDTIQMRGPKGHVEYQHAGRWVVKPLGQPKQTRTCHHLCLLAGGTGITPMLQVLQAYVSSCSIVYLCVEMPTKAIPDGLSLSTSTLIHTQHSHIAG